MKTLKDIMFEDSEARRKAKLHFDSMKAKFTKSQKAAKAAREKDAVYFSDRQKWYGPPEYMWDLMPTREDPKLVYSTLRHHLLDNTEEVTHETTVRILKRYQ